MADIELLIGLVELDAILFVAEDLYCVDPGLSIIIFYCQFVL